MKKRKLIPLSLLIITLIPLLGILFFMLKNDAPIVHGNLEYNLKYSTDKTLDIYYPTKLKHDKSPVLLYIHGGAWVAGRKEALNLNRFNKAFNTLRENGYTIISPEYTLAREGLSPFPDCILDGFTAIEWIADHADSLGLDMNNIGIMGESAGGHIAMMNAFASPSDFGLPYTKIDFNYLIDIYGPNDLMHLYHSQTVDTIEVLIETLPAPLQDYLNLPHLIFGFNPKTDSLKTIEFTNKYSPIEYVKPETTLPTLMIHGTQDQIVPFEQSVLLKHKLDDLHAESILHPLHGVDHAFFKANETQKDSIQKWVSQFVIKRYSDK